MLNRKLFRLYARPSFLEGLARLVDFGNGLAEYNSIESDDLADFQALASDWNNVGADIMVSIEKFQSELDSENDN